MLPSFCNLRKQKRSWPEAGQIGMPGQGRPKKQYCFWRAVEIISPTRNFEAIPGDLESWRDK
jgi:hypothetical protein